MVLTSAPTIASTLPDARLAEPGGNSELVGELFDDLSAGSRSGVGKVFDFEVAGISDEAVGDVVGQGWFERSVFVERNFVAGCDECGMEQDRDGSGLHADWWELQCCVQIVEVDAAIGGCLELFDDGVPGDLELGVGWLADLPVPGLFVATVDAGCLEHGSIHGDFWSVAFEAELFDVFVLEHRQDQEAACLRADRGDLDAVQGLVSDRDGAGVGNVGCLAERGSADAGELVVSVPRDESGSSRVPGVVECLDEHSLGVGAAFSHFVACDPVARRRRGARGRCRGHGARALRR